MPPTQAAIVDLPPDLFEDDGAEGVEPESPELPELAPLPDDAPLLRSP